ncbi:tetratricopeptide repeat protein [Mesorhizobium sp. ZC-5]|uniref:tetratricopeptide repeat protein n=1 Tax=Mesorhizobium sp. ZC-5 TaxID=2986066 RepID=UPI0021E98EA8|nr:tetratricopeptide repeat protein [Mesorhizobium sp. ZC-5]MCV3238761.1 sel1 repeat family protein [Mesorhizobium sp. ZC-5]
MSYRSRLIFHLLAALAAATPAAATDGARPGSPAAAPPAAAAPATPDAGAAEKIDPLRFGSKPADPAYGAFQRGLYKTALNLALPRAEAGEAPAQTLVAEILSRGLGVKRDETAAAKWYQLAAEQGVPEAQFQYALMLIDGRFVTKDPKAAFALMQASAEAGNPLAQFNYAQLLVKRDRGRPGIEAAFPYYQKAAEADLPDAQYAMSQILANGTGGQKPDDVKAREWLVRAARQNYDTAQLDLGSWLISGRGGERDLKSGFAWLKRAAEGGNVAAQNRVAKLYMQGIGTEPDSIFAAAWYILARRAGLFDPVMDDFMNGLTPEELKTALGRANRLR